jgi:hypothetical protein
MGPPHLLPQFFVTHSSRIPFWSEVWESWQTRIVDLLGQPVATTDCLTGDGSKLVAQAPYMKYKVHPEALIDV